MYEEAASFTLRCQTDDDDCRPALVGVKAEGRVDGVLFDLVLRQTYRNTSAKVLEVVYTFPLPHSAVLLSLATELNGSRMQGVIQARQSAEQTYEQALSKGDAPIMLEHLGNGLHTANIGNLKPGDELLIELRYAQVLAFEQGRLRLCIPTTVAPRYGQAITAGLQAQQVPEASLTAAYPLELAVSFGGPLAQAELHCPTHRFLQQRVGRDTRLELTCGAWLDRDVVITAQPTEWSTTLVLQTHDLASDEAPTVLLASFQPGMTDSHGPLALKVLLDCSGSMAGDSIASAKAVLSDLLGALHEDDSLSLTKFGSHVQHLVAPASLRTLDRAALAGLLSRIDADLGGTEMEAALRSVFALKRPPTARDANVLLLTDGDIWQADSMVAAARASGHRVFVIGVGS